MLLLQSLLEIAEVSGISREIGPFQPRIANNRFTLKNFATFLSLIKFDS